MSIDCSIYARASTNKQEETVEHQISMLREFIKMRGEDWVIKDEYIYEDEDVSASKTIIYERPAFKQLLNDAKAGKFKIVLFKSLSRFARDVEEQYGAYYRLVAQGIRFIALEDDIDSEKLEKDANARLVFGVKAVVNQNYNEGLAISVKLGMKEVAKEGKYTGGLAADGYIYNKEKGLLIKDETRYHIIERIFNMYVFDNIGSLKIAQILNNEGNYKRTNIHWKAKDVLRILRNPVYTGMLVFNKNTYKIVRNYDENDFAKKKRKCIENAPEEWIIKENCHEPIISKEIFEMTKRKLDTKSYNRKPPNCKHPLAGILICGFCGSSMITHSRKNHRTSGISNEKIYRYYECTTRRNFGYTKCEQNNINADNLEKEVLNALTIELRSFYNDKEFWSKVKTVNINTLQLQKQLKELLKSIDKNQNDLIELFDKRDKYPKSIYDKMENIYLEKNKKFRQEISQIEEQIEQEKKGNDKIEQIKQEIDKFFHIENFDLEQTRKIFDYFLTKVIIRKDLVEIETCLDVVS